MHGLPVSAGVTGTSQRLSVDRERCPPGGSRAGRLRAVAQPGADLGVQDACIH